MRKIDYPEGKLIKSFHTAYYKRLKKNKVDMINRELAKAPKFKGQRLTFKRLVTLDFKSLFELTKHLDSFLEGYNYKKKVKTKSGKNKYIDKNRFNDLFNYKANQPSIASFFMSQSELKLKTCCYCGIDYINSFKDLGDYKDYVDFLNRAPYHDLIFIDGVGEKTAKKIQEQRKKARINNPKDVISKKNTIKQLKSFNFSASHNHFTLDHVLPQSKYGFLSLCLYNLVPSCYSCNSKFKKAKDFIINDQIIRVSPTSENYSLTSDFNFKIFYSGKMQHIKSSEDLTLYRKVRRNKNQIQKYAQIFKIDGRYTFHKDELIELIQNKIEYSKKKIEKMSSEMGKTADEIKEMIYGKELFLDDVNRPLHKLKRDVADQIKI